jgi:hypothetical protein
VDDTQSNLDALKLAAQMMHKATEYEQEQPGATFGGNLGTTAPTLTDGWITEAARVRPQPSPEEDAARRRALDERHALFEVENPLHECGYDTTDVEVRWWRHDGAWTRTIDDAGSTNVSFCPFCGVKLETP